MTPEKISRPEDNGTFITLFAYVGYVCGRGGKATNLPPQSSLGLPILQTDLPRSRLPLQASTAATACSPILTNAPYGAFIGLCAHLGPFRLIPIVLQNVLVYKKKKKKRKVGS